MKRKNLQLLGMRISDKQYGCGFESRGLRNRQKAGDGPGTGHAKSVLIGAVKRQFDI